jgi:hypothetical protein
MHEHGDDGGPGPAKAGAGPPIAASAVPIGQGTFAVPIGQGTFAVPIGQGRSVEPIDVGKENPALAISCSLTRHSRSASVRDRARLDIRPGFPRA